MFRWSIKKKTGLLVKPIYWFFKSVWGKELFFKIYETEKQFKKADKSQFVNLGKNDKVYEYFIEEVCAFFLFRLVYFLIVYINSN